MDKKAVGLKSFADQTPEERKATAATVIAIYFGDTYARKAAATTFGADIAADIFRILLAIKATGEVQPQDAKFIQAQIHAATRRGAK